MIQMKERRVCRLIFFQTMLCYVEGISLYPASDLTTQSFSLVCDLEGTSALNAFSFTYNGTSAGGCGSPPSPSCFSLIGTIAWSDQMVNFTLHQNEITSKGNAEWTCTHGTDTASFFTRVIALCTNIEVKYADSNMDISCSCGYPSVQAEVEYKASQNGNSLKRQTFDLASSPAINCTTDTRAMDYSTKIENFPSGTKEVCATVKTYSQTTTPKTICKSVPGLTTLASTINSDMSTTVSEPSTFNSDMQTTVSEELPPPVTISSKVLSQEKVITIIISSILAAGVLIIVAVIAVKQCRHKNRETLAKNNENYVVQKQGNFIGKDTFRSSNEPRKSEFLGKRNTKQENISLDKFQQTHNYEASKDKHFLPTADYMYLNNGGNRQVFTHSHTERDMILYGYQQNNYPKSHSRPNNRMLYQSHHPEHPRHNEGMLQYYRADNQNQGQQIHVYQRPYVAQYDYLHIENKPENKRFEGRTYERNWDLLY